MGELYLPGRTGRKIMLRPEVGHAVVAIHRTDARRGEDIWHLVENNKSKPNGG